MNERIDHAAEARRIEAEVTEAFVPLKNGGDIPLHLVHNLNDNAARELATAQVHATLALVEQQRIANLIALFTIDTKDAADFATVGFSYPAALVDITEGLGLS